MCDTVVGPILFGIGVTVGIIAVFLLFLAVVAKVFDAWESFVGRKPEKDWWA